MQVPACASSDEGDPPKLLVLGPPGAGKSTLAAGLAQRLGAIHLSTGQLLRGAVARREPVAEAVRPYVERGDLVPDPLILAVVDAALSSPDVAEHGYVLDGFPRTPEQATAFLARHPDGIEAAIELQLAPEEARRRLVARGRLDDAESVVEHRLAAYEAEVDPLRRVLAASGGLVRVGAGGPPDEVLDRVCRVLAGRGA